VCAGALLTPARGAYDAGSTWNVLHEMLLKLIKAEKDADVMRFATGRGAREI